jgi:LysM repeat protein
MNKFYLLFFACNLIINSIIAQITQDFVVANDDGASIIKQKTQVEMSLLDIAEDFNISIDLLKLFNNYSDTQVLNIGTEINIPLTETNYFKNTKISTNNAVYYPVYYIPNTNDNMVSVCKKFFVTEFNLMNWNNLKTTDIGTKDKLQIGWYKYGQNNNITNKEKAANRVAFNTQSSFKEDVKRDWKSAQTKVRGVYNSVSKTKIQSNNGNKTKPNLKLIEKEKLKTDFNSAVDRTKETFVTAGEKIQSTVKQVGGNKVKKTTNPVKAIPKIEIAIIDTPKVELAGEKIPQETNQPQGIYQLAGADTIVQINESEVGEAELSTINEMKPIQNTNTTSGKAGWFYSGPIGNEYYVFTNKANKGEYVWVEAKLDNSKKIKAKVLGPLKEEELENEQIILVSDNAKDYFKAGNQLIDVNVIPAN